MMRNPFFVFALVLFVGAAARDAADTWISRTELPVLIGETSVEMLDRNGDLLRAYTVADGRWRFGARPDMVDHRYIDMLVAYEDKRFFHHAGVDPIAMMRAIAQALWNGRVVSGGSTITMQVARLLEESGTGRWKGKLRQVRVALALERKLSKNRILELYLTHAPFGGNLEGIRAATLAYFGKEPTRLTPAQAALLVALPQSPEARRPDRDLPTARAARNRVLQRMFGFDLLSDETLRTALREPMLSRKLPFPALAPHLTDRARAHDPLAAQHRLTLDGELQKSLENLARNHLRGKQEELSIAMLVADHSTGEILASVGSATYGTQSRRQGFVDMTRAVRSPGSTLKPLVYAMAFDRGLAHPETMINDRPVAFGAYAPQNFDGKFRGELRVSQALRLSLNIPVILLVDEIGPARFMEGLRRAGMNPIVPGGKAGLAVALGGVGTSLNDLIHLYAALARGGEAIDLQWKIGASPTHGARVVSRAAAWQVGHILAGMTPPGGKANNRLAYKTGTSYGHRDAWTIGWDGAHVAGVWIGRPDGTPVPGVFGGAVAVPILSELFQRLKLELAPLSAPPPETLIVSGAQLPQPLQHFRGRNAVFLPDDDAPVLMFPPDGARLPLDGGPLTIKIRDGVAPFTIMVDGMARITGTYRREISLSDVGIGFVHLAIIDARGRASHVTIRVD